MSTSQDPLIVLLDRISDFELQSYGNSVKQLFNYLKSNFSKDNPIYSTYIAYDLSEGDEKIPFGPHDLPVDFDQMKAVAFYVYHTIANSPDLDFARTVAVSMFRRVNNVENISRLNATFLSYFEQVVFEITNYHESLIDNTHERKLSQIVFVIHGHDFALLDEVKLLLLTARIQFVILKEEDDKGRTTFQKLIDVAKRAGYAIALFTPDDITTDGNKLARQNVLLEMGYFLGMLGPQNVRMVVRNETLIPSDLVGILYTKYSPDLAWKINLLREMKSAGISIDIESILGKL